MKKLANWLLVLLALILLTGCGAKVNPAADADKPQAAEDTRTRETEPGAENAQTAEEARNTGTGEITMARLTEANRAAGLLDKYGSLSQTSVMEYGPDRIFSSIYTEKGLAYVQYMENIADMTDGAAAAYLSAEAGDAYYFAAEGGLVFSVCLYALPEAERERIVPENAEILDPSSTLEETITAITELDGGAVRVDTEGRDSEGSETSCSYVVDAETLELRSMEDFTSRAGYQPTTLRAAITPGAARPALAEEMLDLLNGALTAQDNRTVRVIADPGQDGEQVYSLTVKKGVHVYPVLGENYTLCQQTEAGMIPYLFHDDPNTDQTLYAISDYQP